jgi:hypothetical protein
MTHDTAPAYAEDELETAFPPSSNCIQVRSLSVPMHSSTAGASARGIDITPCHSGDLCFA